VSGRGGNIQWASGDCEVDAPDPYGAAQTGAVRPVDGRPALKQSQPLDWRRAADAVGRQHFLALAHRTITSERRPTDGGQVITDRHLSKIYASRILGGHDVR
jgi:hypothetical protein